MILPGAKFFFIYGTKKTDKKVIFFQNTVKGQAQHENLIPRGTWWTCCSQVEEERNKGEGKVIEGKNKGEKEGLRKVKQQQQQNRQPDEMGQEGVYCGE